MEPGEQRRYPKCEDFTVDIPAGLQTLLTDLSEQVLTAHPSNIYCFLAEYLSRRGRDERHGILKTTEWQDGRILSTQELGPRRSVDTSLQKRLSAAHDLIQSSLDLRTKCAEKLRTAERLQLLPPSDVAQCVTDQENVLRKQLSVVSQLLHDVSLGGLELKSARSIEMLICKEVNVLLAEVRNMTRALELAQVSARTLEALGVRREQMGCQGDLKPMSLHNSTQWEPQGVGQQFQSCPSGSKIQMTGAGVDRDSVDSGWSYANLPYFFQSQGLEGQPGSNGQCGEGHETHLQEQGEFLTPTVDAESSLPLAAHIGELPPRNPNGVAPIEGTEAPPGDSQSLAPITAGGKCEGEQESMEELCDVANNGEVADGAASIQEETLAVEGELPQTESADGMAEKTREMPLAGDGEGQEMPEGTTEEATAETEGITEGALEKVTTGEGQELLGTSSAAALVLGIQLIPEEHQTETAALLGVAELNVPPPVPLHTFSPGNSEENLATWQEPAAPQDQSQQAEESTENEDLTQFFSGQIELVRQVMWGERSVADSPVHAAIIGAGVGLLGYGLVQGVCGFWGWAQGGGHPSLNSVSDRLADICYNNRNFTSATPSAFCHSPFQIPKC